MNKKKKKKLRLELISVFFKLFTSHKDKGLPPLPPPSRFNSKFISIKKKNFFFNFFLNQVFGAF